MPGPLSSTMTRKRDGWLGDGAGATSTISTRMSGRIPASSQASSELSTASFTVVSSALAGLSNPSRWRFLVKNSLTEISRCREAIDSAVALRLGSEGGGGCSESALDLDIEGTPASRSGERVSSGPTGPGIVSVAVIRNPKAILALLTALNLLNYVDRYILSAVLAPMRSELHLSGLVAGWLPTFFLLGYFATSPIFGHLGDSGRRGTRGALMA